MKKIEQELADVFIYAFDMAVLLGLDTKAIIQAKLEKVRKKYPSEIMRKNSKKGSGSGTDAEYLKIKQRHRRAGK